MSKLKVGDFIYVTKGNLSFVGKVLQLVAKQSSNYYYNLYQECSDTKCNLDKFSKIKLHSKNRKAYINEYDIILTPNSQTLDDSDKKTIMDFLKKIKQQSKQEVQGLIVDQKVDSVFNRIQIDQERRNQAIMQKMEENRKKEMEENEKVKIKEQILKTGFKHEIKIEDFLMIIFPDNTYILLQCVDINNNNYYFLKLHLAKTDRGELKPHYKDSELNKIRRCNENCINDLLEKSSVFNIYHDAAKFDSGVYSSIIIPKYTKNVNSLFDKETTPVVVAPDLKNADSVENVGQNDKLTIVLKNENNSYGSISNKSYQNKTKRSHFIPIGGKDAKRVLAFIRINPKDVLPFYKRAKKYITEKIKTNIGYNILNNKNKTKSKRNVKVSREPQNDSPQLSPSLNLTLKKREEKSNSKSNSFDKLLHIIENQKSTNATGVDMTKVENLEKLSLIEIAGRNVLNILKITEHVVNSLDNNYLLFKIHGRIYFLKHVKTLSYDNGMKIYKFATYNCENNDCKENETIAPAVFIDSQLNYILRNSEYMALFKKLTDNDKKEISEILQNEENVNDIEFLKKHLVDLMNCMKAKS